ncbi:hypothetical protein SRB5_06080 [Streptomyces sp. RB5]|uniref:DUF6745 domain-containing protein n=1 Tax=Streptomyces smaragdinus TaxID=2585196 RepID=A0A7K0CAM3_9ACTN|nr:hypothetical protein [Streptomyces smaragdinus]MQY10500.1 hypothetical protein [Streptomyces smaragdinus]
MGTVVDVVGRWRAVAAATGPADRDAAEAGVRLAYRLAGLAEPERIEWAASPRAGALAVLEPGDGRGRSVLDRVRTLPWAAARERIHGELGAAGWAERWAVTGEQLWGTTAMLAERIRRGVVEDLAAEASQEPAIRLVLLDAVLGQHDAPWLAAFEGEAPELAGLAAVAGSAGWWWPYEKVAVICERPEALHRDEAGRLDRSDGPAIGFPDGFALYAWRGMPVPAAFLDELGGLTPERIRTEENAELRRVMLEHYGYERWLEAEGAQPVHRDATGVLWRIELDDDEPVVMVEVINSTPEPDGTSRTYWLRVPPTTRTARQGVAWTFGLDSETYQPERET